MLCNIVLISLENTLKVHQAKTVHGPLQNCHLKHTVQGQESKGLCNIALSSSKNNFEAHLQLTATPSKLESEGLCMFALGGLDVQFQSYLGFTSHAKQQKGMVQAENGIR